MGRTTVPVDEQTADALAELKSRGDTYDDVIRRLLRDDYGTPAAEIVRNTGKTTSPFDDRRNGCCNCGDVFDWDEYYVCPHCKSFCVENWEKGYAEAYVSDE